MDGKLLVVVLPIRKIYDLSKELQKDFPALTSRQQNTWCWKLVVAKNISNETFHMASFVLPHGAFLTSESWSFSSLLSHADRNAHRCLTSWADGLRCSFKGACSPRAEMYSTGRSVPHCTATTSLVTARDICSNNISSAPFNNNFTLCFNKKGRHRLQQNNALRETTLNSRQTRFNRLPSHIIYQVFKCTDTIQLLSLCWQLLHRPLLQ